MLDITLIREKPDWVKEQLRKLNDTAAIERVDQILQLDQKRRELLQEVEVLRNYRNRLSKATGQLRGNKKLDLGIRFAQAKAVLSALKTEDYATAIEVLEQHPEPDPSATLEHFEAIMQDIFEAMKILGNRIAEIDSTLETVEAERKNHLLWIPNLPHESVPVAASEEDNIPHPVQGTIPTFDFTPQAHWDLGPALGIIDFERGVKLGGTRFYILAGMGAQLQRALINFLLDQLVHEHGFQEMYVPLMVKEEAMFGSGQFPKFMDTSYRVEEVGTYLLPTAEVALANMFADEVIPAENLPLKFVAHTPCFRKEKMSAGRDVRGIKRLHQFEKVEMFVITRPEDSYVMLEEMTNIAASLCAKLGIPHRRLEIVTGDLGFTASKKYDIEMWAAGAQEWLEVSSCSNTEAFQARRANIKFRNEDRNEFVHMLNGSALGIPRTLIAIMEHYQNADGTITVPDVLRPYLNGKTIIEP
ncbi:MAG: serine--tRNA ligase [Phototrophicales bacterium]|nr:MAG: serine--tRNA ligase [Phototrophicales bacterium]